MTITLFERIISFRHVNIASLLLIFLILFATSEVKTSEQVVNNAVPIIKESGSGMPFYRTLNGCPIKELGYLYYLSTMFVVASTGMYTCPEPSKNRGLVIRIYRSSIGNDQFMGEIKAAIRNSKYTTSEKRRMLNLLSPETKDFLYGDALSLELENDHVLSFKHNGKAVSTLKDSNYNEFYWIMHLFITETDYQQTWKASK